jgi:hypothetical protein
MIMEIKITQAPKQQFASIRIQTFNPPEFHQNEQTSAIKKLLETTSTQYPINKLKQSNND